MTRGRAHLGRVLVVDDDPPMRRAIQRQLVAEGWMVTLAENGRAGIDAMREGREHFDCVVSDVHMPELDGFGLIAAIRRYDDDLPVLLVTGDPSLDGAVRAIESGAVSYLAKPFDAETLASAVARAARRHGVARMRRRADEITRELDAAHAGELEDVAVRFENALARSWMGVPADRRLPHARAVRVRGARPHRRGVDEAADVLIATRSGSAGSTIWAGRCAPPSRGSPRRPRRRRCCSSTSTASSSRRGAVRSGGPLLHLTPRIVLEITERSDRSDRRPCARRDAAPARLPDRARRPGAGYTGLGALATLEPDFVKLDMSLVRDLPRHPAKRRVVGALATLVRESGPRSIAEGVETSPSATRSSRPASISCRATCTAGRPASLHRRSGELGQGSRAAASRSPRIRQ